MLRCSSTRATKHAIANSTDQFRTENCHTKKENSEYRLIENLLNYNFPPDHVHRFWSDEQWEISWKKYVKKLAWPISRLVSAVRQSTKQNDRTGSLWLTHVTQTSRTWSRNAKHQTLPFGKMIARKIPSNIKTFTLQSTKSKIKDEVPKICRVRYLVHASTHLTGQ